MCDMRRALRGLRRACQLTASAVRIAYLRLAFPGISVSGDSVIGPGCEITVGRGATVVLRGVVLGRGCQVVAGPGAVIDIAADSVGPHSVIVARQRVEIGEGAFLAEMTVVRDSDHDRSGGVSLRFGAHRSGAVRIGRDVWLGSRATVLLGVHIGDGATVGAAAVVTRDVPAGVTVVGVPARPIRARQALDEPA